MAEGAHPSDGYGGAPSNNDAQKRRSSSGALRGRRRQTPVVPAANREHPAHVAAQRSLINPTQLTSADAQAGVGPALGVQGLLRAGHALGVENVGGVVRAPAAFGIELPNAIRLFLEAYNGSIGAMAAPPGPSRAQPHFDINAGLLGPPLRRNQVNLGGVAAMAVPALAEPYFDIDAGLSGPALRRSEAGPFF